MAELSLGEAMMAFINSRPKLKGMMQAHQLTEIWESVMGKTIAKYTEKLEIHKGTLFITTSVAPLRQEIMFQRERIISEVNKAFDSAVVEKIVLR